MAVEAAAVALADQGQVQVQVQENAMAIIKGKLFKNAFLVHGVKHICDNALKESYRARKCHWVVT